MKKGKKENKKSISGFSKLNKRGKIKWLVENFFKEPEAVMHELISFWHSNEEKQKILDEISENTISNFHLPYGVAPNFLIDGTTYAVPMVIEESSVVAAASHSAKFWMERGGFQTQIISTTKVGQIHFYSSGDIRQLRAAFEPLKKQLNQDAQHITHNMVKRGGGVQTIELLDFRATEPNYYQMRVTFETCNSMGANFINSVLEQYAKSLKNFVQSHPDLKKSFGDIEIIMSILSNYTPECVVKASVQCSIQDLGTFGNMKAQNFASRFYKAVRIAHVDPYRAVTHNKGILNGIDAVVLATGNDFRAIEAGAHAFAARDGQYRSLSHCSIQDDIFHFWLKIPLAVGTVGGLTTVHPVAKRSIELLGHPSATQLMSIIASVGLAQNFAALRSLITTGIQSGHMKMHLTNILRQFEATEKEITTTLTHFKDKVVSFSAVREYLDMLRKKNFS